MKLKDIVEQEITASEEEAYDYMKGTMEASYTTKRTLRPNDIARFVAGPNGTDKSMGENDTTVPAGTGINMLQDELSSNEVYVIEGFYLPAATGYSVSYIEVDLGDSKNRWWPAEFFTNEENGIAYVRDPLVVKPGETVKVIFDSDTQTDVTIIILGTVYKKQS